MDVPKAGAEPEPVRLAALQPVLAGLQTPLATSRGRRSVADLARKIRPYIRHYDTTTQTGPMELSQSELSAAVVLQ